MASSTRVLADALAVAPGDRAALVISHPAHELFVHAWLTSTRPRVHVLTDGSGRFGRPRLDRTTRILTEAGAAPGAIYGRLTDRAIYEAVLRQDARLFLGLVRDLAYALSRDRIDYVVGDSLEGAIMTHDLWRILTGAAVELASRARRAPIGNFQFVNIGSRVACVENRCASAIHLPLDAATFQRKVDAARGYDAIAEEVEELLNEHGMDSFRTECMHAVDTRAGLSGLPEEPPLWEVQAETLVAAGCYDRVLRYRVHVLPLVTAVWRCVEEELGERVVA